MDLSGIELLQQLEVEVAGDAKQVTDAGFLETAEQEVADLPPSARASGHRVLPRIVDVVTRCAGGATGSPRGPLRENRIYRKGGLPQPPKWPLLVGLIR